MIEERTNCGDLLAARSDGGCIWLLGNLVEDAFHITDVERSLDLRGGDGRGGLCNGGRGQQGDEHEFGFHGWCDIGLGWLDLNFIRDATLALVAAMKRSWIARIDIASSMPAAAPHAGGLDFAGLQRL